MTPPYLADSRIERVCARVLALMWSVSTIMPFWIMRRIRWSPSAVRPFGLHSGGGG